MALEAELIKCMFLLWRFVLLCVVYLIIQNALHVAVVILDHISSLHYIITDKHGGYCVGYITVVLRVTLVCLKEIGYEGVGWMCLAQRSVQWGVF
jgi:hypothetical protein